MVNLLWEETDQVYKWQSKFEHDSRVYQTPKDYTVV